MLDAVIVSYGDEATRALFEQGKERRFRSIERVGLRKLQQLHAAQQLQDMASPPGSRLETMKGDRKGQHSIRINDQWRICFRWHAGDAHEVEIVDYH